MGAFGRLLISRWGGNIPDNYSRQCDPPLSDEERRINDIRFERELWEQYYHDDIYDIRDKIMYGKLKIDDVKKKDFKDHPLPNESWKYFLIWKSKQNKKK